MTEYERIAVAYLPVNLAEAVQNTLARWNLPMAEIRLRREGMLTLTLGYPKRYVSCGAACHADELALVVDRLCGGSLYAHSETIREGVILTAEGLRVGIVGRAVRIGGKIECVRDIASVNIRVPHRVWGAADPLLPIVRLHGSVLLCSPPGMGKTTMLRELIPRLAEDRQVAVIDTRFELGEGIGQRGMADFYPGWQRSEGILAAVCTMAPDCILCDEISDAADCDAVRMASAAGVAVIASAHGGSPADVRRNPHLARLLDDGVFGCVCGIGADGLAVWEGDS